MRATKSWGDARLLIVTADDAGLCHSVNQAVIQGLEEGLVTTASVMAVTPWFAEIAEYAYGRPDVDLGVHLTFTCEWRSYRWGPVAGGSAVPGLCAPDGAMWPTTEELQAHAQPEEVELEGRAQIERCRRSGLSPTHLDSHMHALFYDPRFRKVLADLAADYDLPIRMLPEPVLQVLQAEEFREAVRSRGIVFPDDLILPPDEGSLAEFWPGSLERLQIGTTEAFIHVGLGGQELLTITDGDDRRLELDLFGPCSPLSRVLEAHGITLVGYRMLRDLQRAAHDRASPS